MLVQQLLAVFPEKEAGYKSRFWINQIRPGRFYCLALNLPGFDRYCSFLVYQPVYLRYCLLRWRLTNEPSLTVKTAELIEKSADIFFPG